VAVNKEGEGREEQKAWSGADVAGRRATLRQNGIGSADVDDVECRRTEDDGHCGALSRATQSGTVARAPTCWQALAVNAPKGGMPEWPGKCGVAIATGAEAASKCGTGFTTGGLICWSDFAEGVAEAVAWLPQFSPSSSKVTVVGFAHTAMGGDAMGGGVDIVVGEGACSRALIPPVTRKWQGCGRIRQFDAIHSHSHSTWTIGVLGSNKRSPDKYASCLVMCARSALKDVHAVHTYDTLTGCGSGNSFRKNNLPARCDTLVLRISACFAPIDTSRSQITMSPKMGA